MNSLGYLLGRQLTLPAWLAFVVLYLVLFGLNSLTHTRNFSADSMNYVDVAHNIATGRGITQSTPGYNQPHFFARPETSAPLTAQPPLYPLLIALLSAVGVPYADAALLIAAGCYALALLVAFLLASDLYDRTVATLSTSGLVLYDPLASVSRYAWSESLAILCALLGLWLLVRERWADRGRSLIVVVAGVASGLAFATRYAMIPLLIVGIALVAGRAAKGSARRRCSLYVLGFAVPAGPVLVRNTMLTGSPTGSPPNPSTLGYADNVIATLGTLTGQYVPHFSFGTQVAFLALMLLTPTMLLIFRGQLVHSIRRVTVLDGRYVLCLWAFAYLALLVYQRTQTHFDLIGVRFIAPAGVALVIVIAAYLSAAASKHSKLLIAIAAAMILLAVALEARTALGPAASSAEQIIAKSERLDWIGSHTTPEDLIIGDETVDIPFYFGRSSAVSFSPFPFSDRLRYSDLNTYLRQYGGTYDHVYLVMRDRYQSETQWQAAFGPFVADLVFGRWDTYPNITPVKRLRDAYVFELRRPTD